MHMLRGVLAGIFIVLPALIPCGVSTAQAADAQQAVGWLNWRGPQHNGTSAETGLPDTWQPGDANTLWSYDLNGRGAAVVANGRVFAFGYKGEGPDLREVLVCLDAASGKMVWEHYFSDFLSDIVYDRYSIGAPSVDPETGNVYVLTSPGIFACFTADGKPVFEHSMMESFGKLTFPNGRTGGPAIDGDLVYIHGITANWGAEGSPMDRYYAFDKHTGEPIWSSAPGIAPKDSSFGTPVFAWHSGKRVFYCGSGDGNIVCVNALTGEPLWRFPLSRGGINASVVLHDKNVIAIHRDENMDESTIGRMIAVTIPDEIPKAPAGTTGTLTLPPTAELWRNTLTAVSSSPVVVGDRIYQIEHTGQLCAVDAKTGKVLWEQKLAPDQLHASPLYADGKLYIPFQNGTFFIVRPGDTGAEVLSQVQLDGYCLGAPTVYEGRIFLFTTKKFYCIGNKERAGEKLTAAAQEKAEAPKPGPAAKLQVIPSEVVLQPGGKAHFKVRSVDANGVVVSEDVKEVQWAKYIPPTAKVKAMLDGDFNAEGELVAAQGAKVSAGAFEATAGELKGHMRARILPAYPYQEDFEAFTPAESNAAGTKFAYPPLPWIGARFKWEVRDLEGSKVLAKTTEVPILMRAITFIGAPDSKNYTMEADVMSDGNRRTKSDVGIINQRYIITLLGNWDVLEVLSNQDRVKVDVPFVWERKTWYRLKSRVDENGDGSGVVRVKAWKRGDPEPEAWTLEAPIKHIHTHGAPGVYGFALGNQFPVYIDNIVITPNP